MGLFDRLMILVRWLRDPKQKPPVSAHLDARLDVAEARLERLAEGFRRGDGALKSR